MTSVALLDVGKLAKICGLFSSDHIGERAEAAAHADKIVRQAGLTWPDILKPQLPGTGNREVSWRRDTLTPGELLAMYGCALTGWEKLFLAGLVRRNGKLTPKQAGVLAGIQARFQ